MIKLKHFAYLISIMIILVSCKNDTKENQTDNKIENSNVVTKKSSKKKEIVAIDNGDNLIFPRLIFNEDTKLFAGALSSSGLTRVFSEPEKKYVVFAPSNDAFKEIKKDKLSSLFSDRELLAKKMKGHIIEDKLDYLELSNKINASGGVYSLKSISGSKLKASLNGSKIIIKDNNGNEAKVIGDKSITTKNGIIYIIDKVLNVN
ncbi:MAG: putative surface protein with fasciclin (FAS1) repeats [Flavobacteriaceae bacterium]|jgi:uncharacterized surface protein with fasciclin (FAS1) repeats